jgi:hypothetical protein
LPKSLVVEVVAGDDHVVTAVDRRLVENVSLAHAARRTRNPTRRLRSGRHVVAVVVAQRHHLQNQTALGGETLGVPAGLLAVVADTERDVQTVGFVTQLDEQIPHRERVFASRNGHQNSIVRREHRVVVNGLGHLTPTQLEEMLRAEIRVVARKFDDGRFTAGATLHVRPRRR